MSHRVFKAYNAAEYFGGLTETQVSALNDDDLQLYHTVMQIGSGGVFLRDSVGNDWYTWQKTLSDHTLKIAYNPTDGIVSHAAFDASALVPQNLAVAEIAADRLRQPRHSTAVR